jgi:hypothetical protein
MIRTASNDHGLGFSRAVGAVAATSSLFGVAYFVGIGCSSSSPSSSTQIQTDAGTTMQGVGTVPIAGPDGGALKSFAIGGPAAPGAGSFYVTISGESNAINGYPFPPDNFMNDTYMFDGWQFEIDAYIVIVDKITLWSNPNQNATNQELHGPAVAELTGPFVVDLHKGGAIVGQGGYPEQATPIGVITNQNLNGGAAFDPTTTYGFGFSTIPAGMPYAGYTGEVAGYDAYNVNLDPSEAEDYAYMVANGASVYYRGHAVWLGNESEYGCTQTNAGNGIDAGLVPSPDGGEGGVPTYVDGGYDFTKMPENGMNFRFAFSTPTNYVNCQNYTMPGMGIGGEANPRGVQASTSTWTIAQVTVHMDHPFWQSFAEDTPVHWDDIAGQYVGVAGPSDGGLIESHIDDFHGVPFQPFTDHTGTPLPWRNCAGPYYTPPGNGAMFFTTLSVPVCPHGTNPAVCIRDYYDYIRYTQSTQGHLNSQGLCFIDRQFPSPPGGS